MSPTHRELVFATHNEHKAAEIEGLLPPNFRVKTLKEIGCLEDIPEEQPTLEGNALQKARFVFEEYRVDCFADDTGLEVEALNGAPGVFSARYAGPERESEKNIDLVLKELTGEKNRKARFRTVMALILDGKEYLFEGIVEGEIRTCRAGVNGFGYDSVFEPEKCGKTFAEMNLEEKNMKSHRSRAIEKMTNFLQ